MLFFACCLGLICVVEIMTVHEAIDDNCFSDRRISFPPESVLLKRPFSIQPWLDSEENIGNLLMVRPFFPFVSLPFWLLWVLGEIY